MSEAGKRLVEGATEALAVARGEVPAARVTMYGHHYVPERAWQPPETAPHDRPIIVYGQPDDTADVRFNCNAVYAAYWDEIDSSFCLKGATWLGPFIKPLCWMDEPDAPPMLPALAAAIRKGEA